MLLTLKTNPLGKLNIMPTVIPYYLPPLPCYKLGNGGKADMQNKDFDDLDIIDSFFKICC